MPVKLINDFSGGINSRFRQNSIIDNQSPTLRNVQFTREGALTKRLGTTRNTVPGFGALKTIYFRSLADITSISIAGGDLLVADSSKVSRTVDLSTFTSLITGLDNSKAPEFIEFQGKTYMTNDKDAVQSISTANAVAQPAGYPVCRFHIVHKNYVFTFNSSVNGSSRLQWSERLDPTSWVATNIEDIYPADGYQGVGIFSFGEELILFKGPVVTNQGYAGASMFAIIGDTFDATNPTYFIKRIPLPPNTGLLSHRSIAIYNGQMIFLTNDGFYAYAGGGAPPIKISEIIRDDIDDIETSDIHTPARQAAAIIHKNRYICSVYDNGDSADLFNNKIFTLDGNTWWADILSNTTDDADVGSSTGGSWAVFKNTLYSASSFVNVVRGWETGFNDPIDINGNDSFVNASYKTKEFDFMDEQMFDKVFIHMRKQASGILTFEYQVDQAAAISSSVSMTAADAGTQDGELLRKGIRIGKRGRTIQFRFHDRNENDIEVYALQLYHTPAHKTREHVGR